MRLVRLVAALFGVVAIAGTAATISSTVETGAPDGGSIGPGEDATYTPSPIDRSAGGEGIPPFLEYLVIVLVILLAIALAWYLIAHRRDVVKTLAVSLVAVAVALVFGWLIAQLGPSGAMNTSVSETADGEALPGGGAGDGETGTIPFGSLFLLLLTVGVIFASAFVLSRDGDRSKPVDDRESDRSIESTAKIGTTAGHAADRIVNSEDVDNEVYRAWRELTRHLEVDRPESSTPGEFADAAVEAGMAREHVSELTRLFEDVRYGHRETTAELEARAVTILRKIEETYAADRSDAETDADESKDGMREPESWGDRP